MNSCEDSVDAGQSEKKKFYRRYRSNRQSDSPVATLLIGWDVNQKYIEQFEEEEMDIDTFSALEEDDLLQLGVDDFITRQKILKNIKGIKKTEQRKPAEKPLPANMTLDALKVVLYSGIHLDSLNKLIKYVQYRLKDRPVINQYVDKGIPASEAAVAISELNLKRIVKLHLELQGLLQDIETDEKNKQPLVPLRTPKKRRHLRIFLVSAVLTTSLYTVFQIKKLFVT